MAITIGTVTMYAGHGAQRMAATVPAADTITSARPHTKQKISALVSLPSAVSDCPMAGRAPGLGCGLETRLASTAMKWLGMNLESAVSSSNWLGARLMSIRWALSPTSLTT